MKLRVLAIMLMSLLAGERLAAQRVTAGVQLAFAEYAEQSNWLRFIGGGVGANIATTWRRYSLTLAATHLALQPRDHDVAAAMEDFALSETEMQFRVRATRLVTGEAALFRRTITPRYAAQSMSAARLGAVLTFPLAVGSDLTARGGLVGGAKFSGGGSAPFGVEVGLGASYAPRSERVRATGDLEFQRIDRRVSTTEGSFPAPIQSSVARLGVAVSF
jgi:hypothetical protein